MSPKSMLSVAALIGILVALSSCDLFTDPECTSTAETYTGTFPTFTTIGAPVGQFTLVQSYTSHSPAGCNENSGPVVLSITSTAPVPLGFSYTLQGLGATGLTVWTYNGVVPRITPGQTISVGQVASTRVHVDVGARVVFTSLSQVP